MKRIRSLRQIALLVHRYVGLFIAVFLTVAGFTGSLIAFNDELYSALSPALHKARPHATDAQPIHPLVLRERLLATMAPGARIGYLPLHVEPERAVRFFVERDKDDDTRDNEFFVDPYSGKLLGSRHYGDIRQGLKNLMPLLYQLHYSLALERVGSVLFGAVALLWTLDCFIGAYLTLPPPAKSAATRRRGAWLKRWRQAWVIRAQSFFALLFTWHRATGLWLWAMLLVFAWSAVGLNLQEVYIPVMRLAFGSASVADRLPILAKPRPEPSLAWDVALTKGRVLMAREASVQHVSVIHETALRYFPRYGAYRYQVRSTADISEHYPRTSVWFDAQTGKLLAFDAPTGQHAATTANTWLLALHFGDLAGGGLAYRVFVMLMGVLVALLSVSGVLIWLRKTKRRPAKAAVDGS